MYYDKMDSDILELVNDILKEELGPEMYEDPELMHYGTKRHSGRYPWGSGDSPYQHSGDFLARVEAQAKKGVSEKDIAEGLNMTTKELRMAKSIAINERRAALVNQAENYRAHGDSLQTIAKKMGYSNDSSVRSLLNEKSKAKMNEAAETAAFLKKKCDELELVDVGAGTERQLHISRNRMDEALYKLQLEEGYEVKGRMVRNSLNKNTNTILRVLVPPNSPDDILYTRLGDIKSLEDYISTDDGKTFRKKFQYPESMDSKRLSIRYDEDGGSNKDGVIELRRGVKDLDLGNSHYAQVRILVDGTHYLKGMAVYSDDLPDGIDVRFNTNKKKGTPALGPKDNTVLKPIKKDDPNNPFGSLIKEKGGQSTYIDDDGKEKLSLINKRAEEGDWGEWSNKLPSQFLSKQNISLINKQLGLAVSDKESTYEDIMKITNPTVKKHMLQDFASSCDSTAVHLEAAALPNQKYKVILPLESISEKEIYAPGYRNGEQVALVRFPHGGTFEIPILTVNNNNKEGKSSITPISKDGVGINKKTADILSGADFDGDTVLVIPTNSKTKITSRKPLSGLEGFDPKMEYPYHEGMKVMSEKYKQQQMGVVSNLITDMTIKGASDDELAAAVRHSMVVIDAPKHRLDYKQSEIDNHIHELKAKYQGHIGEDGTYHEGSTTIISRAKSQINVNKRIGTPKIDPETGKLIYKDSGETYIDKKGRVHTRTIKSTKMMETDDAYSLVSDADHKVERAYAEYANKMKAMANNARLAILATTEDPYNKTAAEAYATEVSSLKEKLNLAMLNAPRERRARIIAESQLQAQMQDNPSLKEDTDARKKYATRALQNARVAVGSKRTPVTFTDKEWEAINAGAVRKTLVKQLLDKADSSVIKQRVMPHNTTELSSFKQNKIKAMAASSYTLREIADALGCSLSTVEKYI